MSGDGGPPIGIPSFTSSYNLPWYSVSHDWVAPAVIATVSSTWPVQVAGIYVKSSCARQRADSKGNFVTFVSFCLIRLQPFNRHRAAEATRCKVVDQA